MSARKTQSTPQYVARRFDKHGLLAIDPTAFFELFLMAPEAPVNDEHVEATVVTIRGPLDQHASGWGDSYEAILLRVADACASSAPAIVLRLDSPGGDAGGCLEAARELRAMCAAARKPLYAWVEGKATSAAYALASAAEHIALSDTALVGSIGVLSTRPDCSAMNAARGLRVAFVASGSRKTDGHPDAPLSEAELKSTQAIVDSLAAAFFALVAEHRPGVSIEDVAQLDANVFHGSTAIARGLADSMQTLNSLLAAIASPNGLDMTIKAEKSDYENAVASLERAAKTDDANGAAARKALAALGKGEGGDDEGGDGADKGAEGDSDDKSAEGSDDDKSAEGGDTSTDDDKKKKDGGESAANATALKALAEVHKLRAELAKRDEHVERERVLATRNDLSPEMLAVLRKSPLSTVRDMVATLPPLKPTAQGAGARASLGASQPEVTPTRGNTQDDTGAPRLAADAKRALDIRMGLIQSKPTAVKNNPYRLTLGEIEPATQAPEQAESAAVGGAPATKH